MIRTISIKSFKSLLDVDFELGKVNVFVGANGSGKSNLLEAIGVLGAAAEGRVNDTALRARGVRPGVPDLYKSSFRGHRKRSSIRIEAADEQARYAVELINDSPKYPGPEWRFKNEKLSEGMTRIAGRSPASLDESDPMLGVAASTGKKHAAARRLLDTLRDFSIYTPTTDTLRGLLADPQRREPLGLSGGRLPEAVSEVLQNRWADPRIAAAATSALELIDWATSYDSRRRQNDIPLSESVESVGDRLLVFRDRFMAEGRNLLTGYDASEGALYVLLMLVLAMHPKAPGFLAIDNADHGLNPRLARSLIHHLCDWVVDAGEDKQILLTTHNPLALDGLQLDNDEVRLFAVDRSRKGRTVVERVRVDVKELFRDGEVWTISRLWVNGHLGGMPNV